MSDEERNGDGSHGTGKRRQRQQCECDAKRDPDHRAHRRAARHTEQVRLGEWIAQRTLQRRARHPQPRADERGEEGAWQSELADDGDVRGIAAPEQRIPHLHRRERDRADGDGKDHRDGEHSDKDNPT